MTRGQHPAAAVDGTAALDQAAVLQAAGAVEGGSEHARTRADVGIAHR